MTAYPMTRSNPLVLVSGLLLALFWLGGCGVGQQSAPTSPPSSLATRALRSPQEQALAQVFYVATNGNDTNAGTSDDPWRTIQHAADVAAPGSLINVRGGGMCQAL